MTTTAPAAAIPHVSSFALSKFASVKELEAEIHQMLALFEGKETEENWVARDKALLRLRGIVRGSAAREEVFIESVKPLIESILKLAASLRTTLSISACTTILDFCTCLGRLIDPCAEIITKSMLKVTSQTKKLVANAGFSALSEMIAHTSYNVRILTLLHGSLQEKNVAVRSYAVALFKLLIDAAVKSELGCNQLEKSGGLDIAEKCLRKGLQDAGPSVRETSREILEALHRIWPQKISNFLDSLDPVSRRSIMASLKKSPFSAVQAEAEPTFMESVAPAAEHDEDPNRQRHDFAQKVKSDDPNVVLEALEEVATCPESLLHGVDFNHVLKVMLSTKSRTFCSKVLKLPGLQRLYKLEFVDDQTIIEVLTFAVGRKDAFKEFLSQFLVEARISILCRTIFALVDGHKGQSTNIQHLLAVFLDFIDDSPNAVHDFKDQIRNMTAKLEQYVRNSPVELETQDLVNEVLTRTDQKEKNMTADSPKSPPYSKSADESMVAWATGDETDAFAGTYPKLVDLSFSENLVDVSMNIDDDDNDVLPNLPDAFLRSNAPTPATVRNSSIFVHTPDNQATPTKNRSTSSILTGKLTPRPLVVDPHVRFLNGDLSQQSLASLYCFIKKSEPSAIRKVCDGILDRLFEVLINEHGEIEPKESCLMILHQIAGKQLSDFKGWEVKILKLLVVSRSNTADELAAAADSVLRIISSQIDAAVCFNVFLQLSKSPPSMSSRSPDMIKASALRAMGDSIKALKAVPDSSLCSDIALTCSQNISAKDIAVRKAAAHCLADAVRLWPQGFEAVTRRLLSPRESNLVDVLCSRVPFR
ncbi:clasp N terminal-domain-containing protein [Zopfochytrium polystomum]|nr:clasp N terminal-domain-containing protein [Zopfochytrium polystomum]